MEAAGFLLKRADLAGIVDAGARLESAAQIFASVRVPLPPALLPRRLALHRAIGRVGLLLENAASWCERRRQVLEPADVFPRCYDAGGRQTVIQAPAQVVIEG